MFLTVFKPILCSGFVFEFLAPFIPDFCDGINNYDIFSPLLYNIHLCPRNNTQLFSNFYRQSNLIISLFRHNGLSFVYIQFGLSCTACDRSDMGEHNFGKRFPKTGRDIVPHTVDQLKSSVWNQVGGFLALCRRNQQIAGTVNH